MVADYNLLQTDSGAAREKLNEGACGKEPPRRVKQVKQVSLWEDKECRRELGTLRAIMRKMIGG